MLTFTTFAVIGGGGLLLNLAVTYALTTYAHLWYFFSFIIATFVSWTAVFFANSHITFAGHSKEAYTRRYLTFITGYFVIFLLNATLVYMLTSILHMHYLVSITVVTGMSAIATFVFSKKLVYRGVSSNLSDDIGTS